MNSDKLKIEIHNIKAISDLEFELPLQPGLYALTGHNGAGKSTIVACASTVFFNMPVTVQLPCLQDPMTIHNFASENQSQQNYVFKLRLREAMAEGLD